MPSEVEKILLPYNDNNIDLLEEVTHMMRANADILKILELTNKKILTDGFGFTQHEINLATNIWQKLSNRRLNRGK